MEGNSYGNGSIYKTGNNGSKLGGLERQISQRASYTGTESQVQSKISEVVVTNEIRTNHSGEGSYVFKTVKQK